MTSCRIENGIEYNISTNRYTILFIYLSFDALLTVHLSIILVINQLNAQILVL